MVALGLRLVIAPLHGEGWLEFDASINQLWMRSAVEYGIIPSFHEQLEGNKLPDHGPVEISVYALMGHAYQALVSSDYKVLQPWHLIFMKFPFIVADIGTGIFLYLIFRRIRGPGTGLLASAVYLFHPAVFYDSAYWGQTDGLLTFFFIVALWALLWHRMWLVSASCALACLSKPQAIIFVPLFFLLSTQQFRTLTIFVLVSGIIVAAVILLFYFGGSLEQLMNVYLHPDPWRLSYNASNFWWGVFGSSAWDRNGHDLLWGIVAFKMVGLMIFSAFYLFILLSVWKPIRQSTRNNTELIMLALSLISVAFFLFYTFIHERYAFPYLAFGIPLLLRGAKGILLYMAVSIVLLLNLYSAWPFLGSATSSSIVGTLCSAILLSLFFQQCALLMRESGGMQWRQGILRVKQLLRSALRTVLFLR